MGSFRQKLGSAVVGFLVVILALGALVFGWYMSGYNAAIAKDERAKAPWAQVENQLQRRNDLIPNLVNTVKGFAAQEKNIFTEVTRLRAVGRRPHQRKAVNAMPPTRATGGAESYPQLKSREVALQAGGRDEITLP